MPLPKNTRILNAVTSKAAPSAASDGVQIPHGAEQGSLFVRSTAGSGTMTALIRLWGYDPNENNGAGGWFPFSIGTGEAAANTSGVLNGGDAIEEVATDSILHYELLSNLQVFSRVDAEIISLGGTGTTISLSISWHKAPAVRGI